VKEFRRSAIVPSLVITVDRGENINLELLDSMLINEWETAIVWVCCEHVPKGTRIKNLKTLGQKRYYAGCRLRFGALATLRIIWPRLTSNRRGSALTSVATN
jgi:hypothetical protein